MQELFFSKFGEKDGLTSTAAYSILISHSPNSLLDVIENEFGKPTYLVFYGNKLANNIEISTFLLQINVH
ncbi:unnamed protein product [Debaryomyces tyrocola]|nr:unnamed protein product [Debaryomyces tyrocola]